MNLWQNFQIQRNPKFENQGFVLRFEQGIEPELRTYVLSFARWLRKVYVFPVRINIYFRNAEKVRLLNGSMAFGGFRWYERRNPMIRVAAAIEKHLLSKYTEEELYAQILSSLVHELSHYYQWILGLEQSDAVSERQANYYRYRIIEQYYDEVKRDC